MKYGLLVCSPSASYKNIGDYIQSVAQEQFLPRIDCVVERESLNSFSSGCDEKTKLIMNGWFMLHPESFPPSDEISPLFTSFHVAPKIEASFFTGKTVEYLKRFQPIGARDTNTMELFRKYGIESYFSGCLTLTLGNTYSKKDSNPSKVVFVDQAYQVAGTKLTLYNLMDYLRCSWYLLKNFRKALKFYKKFTVEATTLFRRISPSFEKLWCAATFYEYYSALFSDDLLINAEYISHKVPSSRYKNNEEWMTAAKELIQKYADSKLVVTSRIHCGLPCLAVETPCLFVNSESLSSGSFRSNGRFGGLLELFNVAMWTKKGIVGVSENVSRIIRSKKRIGVDDIGQLGARHEYRKIRDELNQSVAAFLETIVD